MKKYLTVNLWLQLVIASLLVIPLLGILRNYDLTLADSELGDPVELFSTYPDFMKYFRILMFSAIGCSILPWTRKLYGICLGICLGGLLFFYLDTMSALKKLSEMGLSQSPLDEMIVLTDAGENFSFWCVASVTCFIIAMIIECIGQCLLKRKLTHTTRQKI